MSTEILSCILTHTPPIETTSLNLSFLQRRVTTYLFTQRDQCLSNIFDHIFKNTTYIERLTKHFKTENAVTFLCNCLIVHFNLAILGSLVTFVQSLTQFNLTEYFKFYLNVVSFQPLALDTLIKINPYVPKHKPIKLYLKNLSLYMAYNLGYLITQLEETTNIQIIIGRCSAQLLDVFIKGIQSTHPSSIHVTLSFSYLVTASLVLSMLNSVQVFKLEFDNLTECHSLIPMLTDYELKDLSVKGCLDELAIETLLNSPLSFDSLHIEMQTTNPTALNNISDFRVKSLYVCYFLKKSYVSPIWNFPNLHTLHLEGVRYIDYENISNLKTLRSLYVSDWSDHLFTSINKSLLYELDVENLADVNFDILEFPNLEHFGTSSIITLSNLRNLNSLRYPTYIPKSLYSKYYIYLAVPAPFFKVTFHPTLQHLQLTLENESDLNLDGVDSLVHLSIQNNTYREYDIQSFISTMYNLATFKYSSSNSNITTINAIYLTELSLDIPYINLDILSNLKNIEQLTLIALHISNLYVYQNLSLFFIYVADLSFFEEIISTIKYLDNLLHLYIITEFQIPLSLFSKLNLITLGVNEDHVDLYQHKKINYKKLLGYNKQTLKITSVNC